jgi:hypothetical protein
MEHPKIGHTSLHHIFDNSLIRTRTRIWPLLGPENLVSDTSSYIMSLIISSVIAWCNNVLRQLMLETKCEYEKDVEHCMYYRHIEDNDQPVVIYLFLVFKGHTHARDRMVHYRSTL